MEETAKGWTFSDRHCNEITVPPRIREKVLRDEEIYLGQVIKTREVTLGLVGETGVAFDREVFFEEPIPFKVEGTFWRELNVPSLDTFWNGRILLSNDRLIELQGELEAQDCPDAARSAKAVELVLKDRVEFCYVRGFSYRLSSDLEEIIGWCFGWRWNRKMCGQPSFRIGK